MTDRHQPRKGDRHKPRAGDRHRPGRPNFNRRDPNGRFQALEAGRVVAVDGEGLELGGGRQAYAYLADSSGREIWNPAGIPTKDCLDFLLTGPPAHVVVGYGISYDVEMLLKDLPWSNWRELNAKSITVWGEYQIRYWPKKRISIWHRDPVTRHVSRVVVDDVFSNFGCSFVEAVSKWLPEEDLSVVNEGKARRGGFSVADLPYIRRYTGEELRLLREQTLSFVRARRGAGFKSCDLYSPANLAVELLRRYKCQPIAAGAAPPEVERVAYEAYFGGRIEALAYGTHEGAVVEADINSAYPFAMSRLPDFSKGSWHHVTGNEAREAVSSATWALFHVRWLFSSQAPAYPFPWRNDVGRVFFPPEGQGWVWSPEVRAAFASPQIARETEIAEAWVWNGPEEPAFPWVGEVYEERARRVAAKDPSEFALKLALNSSYGKFCQRVSATKGKRPSFHSPVLAGLITSQTRAALWSAVRSWDGVLTFNTDAIYTTNPGSISVPEGPGLGAWKQATYDGIQILTSGVYRLRSGRKWKTKGRGFGDRKVPWDDIVRGWKAGERDIRAPTKPRFRTHRLAARMNAPEIAGTWEPTGARRLNLRAAGKRVDLPQEERGGASPADRLYFTEPLAPVFGPVESAPNLPSWLTEPTAPASGPATVLPVRSGTVPLTAPRTPLSHGLVSTAPLQLVSPGSLSIQAAAPLPYASGSTFGGSSGPPGQRPPPGPGTVP